MPLPATKQAIQARIVELLTKLGIGETMIRRLQQRSFDGSEIQRLIDKANPQNTGLKPQKLHIIKAALVSTLDLLQQTSTTPTFSGSPLSGRSPSGFTPSPSSAKRARRIVAEQPQERDSSSLTTPPGRRGIHRKKNLFSR